MSSSATWAVPEHWVDSKGGGAFPSQREEGTFCPQVSFNPGFQGNLVPPIVCCAVSVCQLPHGFTWVPCCPLPQAAAAASSRGGRCSGGARGQAQELASHGRTGTGDAAVRICTRPSGRPAGQALGFTVLEIRLWLQDPAVLCSAGLFPCRLHGQPKSAMGQNWTLLHSLPLEVCWLLDTPS